MWRKCSPARKTRNFTARKTAPEKANGKRHASQQSLNGAVKSICDIMRRSHCAGALQYVPELTWMLFLRILDEQENREAEEAAASGRSFKPFCWRDWAAPWSALRRDKTAPVFGNLSTRTCCPS